MAIGIAVALLLLFAGCSPPASPPATVKRPKAIVLISIDTLRADAVSFGGQGRPPTTPFLDSLARDAVVFERAYATSSWTAPSVASMLTGLWPTSHGIRRGAIERQGEGAAVSVVRQPVLAPAIETLAEVLRAEGFATYGVAANLHLAGHLGFGQGFDHYAKAGFFGAGAVNRLATEQLHRALGNEWQGRWRAEPTFLWLHYFDPHMPYEARQPWVTTFAPDFAERRAEYPAGLDAGAVFRLPRTIDTYAKLRALYLSEVRYVDHFLRLLNDKLHFDDPEVLLIVTADHGEEFGEHGGLGHATTLYEEQVRVPLMVRWPAGLGAGARRREQAVSLVDILPTVRALLGREPGAQGEPLPLADDAPQRERPLYLQTDRSETPLAAVIEGGWKAVWSVSRGAGPTPGRLFDLQRDAGEAADLRAEHADVERRLAEALQRFESLPPPPAADGDAGTTDSATAERLRALGYD